MSEELYDKTFYAYFVNGDKQDSVFPFYYHNEYELVNMGVVDPFLHNNKELFTPDAKCSWFAGKNTFDSVFENFQRYGLKGEPFISEKGKFLGNQQIYYVDISISDFNTAREFGEYKKWYKITFCDCGNYSCTVIDYTSPGEGFYEQKPYKCMIEGLTMFESDFLVELYKVYPDEKHITHQPFKTLPLGQQVNQFCVLHCNHSIYLCVEFYDGNDMPVGLFDMGDNAYLADNYKDVQGINWGTRVPFTVIISHFHNDHINGLMKMVNNHNAPGTGITYHYFFSHMDIHLTDTHQPASYVRITQAIAAAAGVGAVHIYQDANPSFNVANHNFGLGKINFNHPSTGAVDAHPHLHGLYVSCTTTGGRRVMIAGDTVYRGIAAVDRVGPYDVLVGCHHGGNYAVSCAGHNYPPGETKDMYIPTPVGGVTSTVIYSSNGDGHGHHPAHNSITDHTGHGWVNGVITNAALSHYGALPVHVHSSADGVTVT